MSTTTVPIRYFYPDGDECRAGEFALGYLVQFGDNEPKLTSEMTPEERELVVAECAALTAERSDPITVRIHGLTAGWTDTQIAERLEIEPGDVPLFRAWSWIVTMGDAVRIAGHAGCDVAELFREPEGVEK